MLNKNVDMALIGKSYLGVLLGLELLDQQQDVLLLDDDRIQFGDLYTNRLCELELSYLKTWGEDRTIEPLLNLDRFLTPGPTTFIFDNTRIRLGDSPSRNYRELIRKLPECFINSETGEVDKRPLESQESIENFDNAFKAYCSRMAKTAFRYKSVASFNLESFLAHCPPLIQELFFSLREVLRKEGVVQGTTYWKLKNFFYMGQGLYQKKLAIEFTDFELFHLFLSLLSPHYILDNDALMDELIKIHLRRGGEFKKTHVREWRFHKGRPWSIELASYEGIIHPRKMSFLGGIPRGMPFKLSPQIRYYNSLNVSIRYQPGAAHTLTGERIIYSGIAKIGTEIPLWETTFGRDHLDMKVFMLIHPGSKVEFIQKEVTKRLFYDLARLIPDFDSQIHDVKMEFGEEIWIDEIRGKKMAKNLTPMPRVIKMVDVGGPTEKTTLSNVHYFGPYKEGPLGLLSSLMEINDQQQFMGH